MQKTHWKRKRKIRPSLNSCQSLQANRNLQHITDLLLRWKTPESTSQIYNLYNIYIYKYIIQSWRYYETNKTDQYQRRAFFRNDFFVIFDIGSTGQHSNLAKSVFFHKNLAHLRIIINILVEKFDPQSPSRIASPAKPFEPVSSSHSSYLWNSNRKKSQANSGDQVANELNTCLWPSAGPRL